jgi:hypothetical protein
MSPSEIFGECHPMTFNETLLTKEAQFHGLCIKPSKFKEAGLGLFASKGS